VAPAGQVRVGRSRRVPRPGGGRRGGERPSWPLPTAEGRRGGERCAPLPSHELSGNM
jgi:hypothetical protein